ncbi:CDP-alcohol phosphatidyltransferase family protein [Allomuricauda sp. F6463D]|uniref:CDP-alcohol phosphatidyltransferase family protein n=1 Tax=Allomuricauda sp. F6463D TaxID=2926409 RepID=UPI001FF50AD6|nr:CDP-alcohol phosphatidyltransferase family protein [Muricauda sp. F6463D]MCK0160241.1 CDP-alcohol phosphatidyltransferase family protein [Muricauda sp. F6463D]
MKSYIPNLLTMLNVLSGCIATVFAVLNHLEWAALFVLIGIFFDFFDGLAARALNVQSEIGIQLDSLADVITSGLVPGVVMFQLLSMAERGGWNLGFIGHDTELTFLPFVGFAITMASAYRLAKFNVDEDQVSSFIGLPTPANALLILSLPMILLYHNNEMLNNIILNPWFLVILTVLCSYLLNSPIRLFALKFKNWKFKDNGVRYLFIIGSLVLLITLRFLAIPVIILFYVLASLLVPSDK